MRLDGELERLTATQHSCIATWQLRELGATRTEISRLRRAARWEPIGARVVKLAGSPRTSEQIAEAAVLEAGPGAGLSHCSAAAHWGLGEWYRLLPAQVMAAWGRAVHNGEVGRIHPLVGVSDHWLTTLDGIPVVRPELCVYQLCGVVNPWRAERALDTAWALGLVSGSSLRVCLNDLAERGRNGTVVLRTLLEERPVGYVPPTTGIEARFQQVMSESGLGKWRKQVDSGGETWAGRVDFRHETLPVIAEVLSERYHAALSSERDDAVRRAKLEAAGFVVVEAWDAQVWHRPREVVAAVRKGIHQAKARAA